MQYGIQIPDAAHKALDSVCYIDDFIGLGAEWSTLAADSGATVAEDADDANGVVNLTTGGTDNNEAYLFTNEVSKFLNGKPILIIGRIQYAEANTDDANILFGMGEGFGAANTLVDNGAGPLADYDGVCLFKVDGGTRWNFETSLGSTQTTTELDVTAGGSSYQTVAIMINPVSSTEIEAWPLFDTAGGNNLVGPYKYTTNTAEQAKLGRVKHRFSYSSPGEMALCFAVKAGGANSEVLKVDLAILAQKR